MNENKTELRGGRKNVKKYAVKLEMIFKKIKKKMYRVKLSDSKRTKKCESIRYGSDEKKKREKN